MSILDNDYNVYIHDIIDVDDYDSKEFTLINFDGTVIFSKVSHKDFLKAVKKLGLKLTDTKEIIDELRSNDIEVKVEINEETQAELNTLNDKNLNDKKEMFKKDLFEFFHLENSNKNSLALDISTKLSRPLNYKQIKMIFEMLIPLITYKDNNDE